MTESNLHSDVKAINDIERMLYAMDKQKISKVQEYWQVRADRLALLTKKQMVVIDQGHENYQVWNKSVADRCGADYCYCTEESGQ